MIKLQRIHCYRETFPCLVVEQFQLGLLPWKNDLRRWFICNSEAHCQLAEPYVLWKSRLIGLIIPLLKDFLISSKELKQEMRALVRKPFFFTVRITNCMN